MAAGTIKTMEDTKEHHRGAAPSTTTIRSLASLDDAERESLYRDDDADDAIVERMQDERRRRDRLLEEENRSLRERLRHLEEENRRLLTASLSSQPPEPEEARSVIQELYSSFAELQIRSDETVAALQNELGRVLHEKYALQAKVARRHQSSSRMTNDDDNADEEKSLEGEYKHKHDDDDDESLGGMDEDDWLDFTMLSLSADFERSFRTDERSAARSRADRESREKSDSRIAELEAELEQMRRKKEGALSARDEEREARLAEEEASATSKVAAAAAKESSFPKEGAAPLSAVPMPGDGLELHSSRAQMA